MVFESVLWMGVVVFVRREARDGGAASNDLETEVPIVAFLFEMTIVIVDDCGWRSSCWSIDEVGTFVVSRWFGPSLCGNLWGDGESIAAVFE